MRRHERLSDIWSLHGKMTDFIKSDVCNCELCAYLRRLLEQGYDITLQLVR